eukprot:TRINITY_DN19518_c0_g1_i1.p1 TRINITY_DN19518_c0_g1~~TRINITY_DN19518_c0_g1_i1.p1  ORF type:complete len:222 (+),score=52.46 TRINITY_DN19518_c0_g1_i1:28-666(+)
MTERFLNFEKRIKEQYAEVCDGLPIDLVSDTWKYRKLMDTNPELTKVIKLSQEKPRARYKVCKIRVEWLLEQPMDIFNINVKPFSNGVIDAFIEEDCPGETDKGGIKNQIIAGLCKECQGCNGCKGCRKKKKKVTGSVGACTSREHGVLNHNQQLSEREKMPKSPEKKNENLEREERRTRAKKLQKEFRQKMEKEKEERIKRVKKLKKRFKQ